ncbi:MAG: glycosyltransferase family 1 protein [Candidatus Paceibacterota bacterium]
MKVLINVQPLSSGHAIRGVGMYTRFLSEALEKQSGIELYRSSLIQRPKKIDIVHYPFFDLFFPTLPIAKFNKTMVTIHDVIPLLFPKEYPVGKRGKLAFAHQKLALKTVAKVITDSVSSQQDIATHLGVPLGKIAVVPLAANPFLQPLPANKIKTYKRKLKLPAKYILYVGDINYNKNIPQLIKALKYLPDDIKLVCVGKHFSPQDIPEWQAIESQVALSNVAKRVIFKPDVLSDDYQTLSAIYSAAAVYVQPSLYEGFGLPVLEAMRCKVPVVAAKNSSLPEVGGEAALFAQPTAEDLAEGVEMILSLTQAKRRAWIKKAVAWEQQFTWEKTAQETMRIYQSIL